MLSIRPWGPLVAVLLSGMLLAAHAQTDGVATATAAPAAPVAFSNEAPRANADPALEKRVMSLSAELRCLVCQNQTIADSNAELAVDLRNQVRDMLREGQNERQVLDYMTARYGDFVLYRPPLKGTTALLWFGPALMLVGGVGTLWFILYRRSRLAPEEFEPDLEAGWPEDELPAPAAPVSLKKNLNDAQQRSA
jgi:cytochrome c-type biogenesis protein CcmH